MLKDITLVAKRTGRNSFEFYADYDIYIDGRKFTFRKDCGEFYLRKGDSVELNGLKMDVAFKTDCGGDEIIAVEGEY